jgi:hypothetical protein
VATAETSATERTAAGYPLDSLGSLETERKNYPAGNQKEVTMKYLVTGSEGPGFASPEEAIEVLERILPTFDALTKLEEERKIVAGGCPLGIGRLPSSLRLRPTKSWISSSEASRRGASSSGTLRRSRALPGGRLKNAMR